jgi:hypothetical protein
MLMNAFYQKLNEFGTLVHVTSHAKKLDMANYFTVMHPAHPIIKNTEQTRPAIRFEDSCPRSVKREVAMLWKMVFG